MNDFSSDISGDVDAEANGAIVRQKYSPREYESLRDDFNCAHFPSLDAALA